MHDQHDYFAWMIYKYIFIGVSLQYLNNIFAICLYVLHKESCFTALHQRTIIYKDLNMFKCLFTIIVWFLCFDISVISVISVNVSPPRPVPIPFTYNPPSLLVKSRVVLRTLFSYKYVTVDLIKFIFLVFLWVLILSPNITRNVRYVKFYWNLSILPRHYETNILFNHTVKSSVYVCTFLSLYEPFLYCFL